MQKNPTVRRLDSQECEKQLSERGSQNRGPPSRMDFLRTESNTEEEMVKERRKKRRSRKSVNDEENTDPEDDSPRDDYKIEVMRRLMMRFSLDETINYYRSINSAEYAINPNNFSLDSSVHAKQMKKRLKHLLGSEVVKVNDKEFMDDVESKLREERRTLMTKKEEERVEMERQRLRRLVSEGHMSTREMRRNKMVMREEGKLSTSKSGLSSSKTKHSQSVKHPTKKKTKSVHGKASKYRVPDAEEEAPEQLTIRYDRSSATHSEMGNSLYNSSSRYDMESQMSRMSKRGGTSTDSGICDSTDDLLLSPEPHQNSSEAAEVVDPWSDQPPGTLQGSRKFQDSELKKLRSEESVEGMYNLAERILPEDRPRSYFEPKKSSRFENRH